MIGTRWGSWTVLEEASKDKHGNRRWRCRCSCGYERVIFQNGLRAGRSTRCRKCASKIACGPAAAKACTTHGRSSDPFYKTWTQIIQRCTNENDPAYKWYGGRGIKVHKAWIGHGGFVAFSNYMGERPSNKHSIDRIDNNKGYVPGNVRWATLHEQARNRRSNRIIKYNNTSRTLMEWAQLTGLKRETIARRLNAGWSVEKALTTPIKGK